MRKVFYSFFCFGSALFAQMPPAVDFSDDHKIAVHNTILAKVNGTTISMIDVKKKMDMAFHQHFSHLAGSSSARYQFYEASWRHVLMEMIDHQLILADAEEKEAKLTDGEVREEMEQRFGPNIMFTLDKIGLTYEESWKMVREELLVRRMTWWFIHSKAMNQVTPQDIRQAFRLYSKENPAYQELAYRVISVKGDAAQEVAEKAYTLLVSRKVSPELLIEALQELDPSIQVSSEYRTNDKTLSEAHKAALVSLAPGEYSHPSLQKSRTDKQIVVRIFYLSERTDHAAPEFEAMSAQLRENLIQKAVAQESTAYLEKLRKHYGFDMKSDLPEDFHPFSLE